MRLVLTFSILALLGLSCLAQNTPDGAWQQVEGLKSKIDEKPPAGANAVDFYDQREQALQDAVTGFVKQYPDDRRVPQAIIWGLSVTEFEGTPDQRLALLHQMEQKAQNLNQTVPEGLRLQAERYVLSGWADNPDLIKTPEEASKLEQRIANYLQKNPEEPHVISFQMARADLLYKTDPAKAKEFLEHLTSDENERLAIAARGRLTRAGLEGNPLSLNLKAVDGRAIDFSKLRGKVIIVDFWASWCPDCIRELPTVQEVYQKYHAQGLNIVGISLDRDSKALSNFIAKKQIPWPQYFDGKGWENAVAEKYGVHEIPAMWIVDKQGLVKTTSASADQLDHQIGEMLKE